MHSIAYCIAFFDNSIHTFESTTVQLKRLNLQQIPKDSDCPCYANCITAFSANTALDIIMCTMHRLLHCQRERAPLHSCYYAMNHIALYKWIRGWRWVVTRGGTATGGGCARDWQASSDKLPYRTSFSKTFTRLAE